MPRYGDGDEGMALQLQPYEARRDSWLYHVGHALLQADVPTQSSGLLAAHLLGINLFDNRDWEAPSGSIAFVEAGLYVLTSNRNAERDIFVLADAGPHGYLSITAHAHADALSFALSIDGQPMIVDIGTFAYHTDEYWRCYFRSTPAHNTLTINGQDQSTQQGSFLWSNQAITTVHSWQTTPDGASLEARHDGYKDQGIIHQRTFQLVDNHLRLSDEIKGAGQHSLQLAFHTAPESTVSQTDQPNILHIQRENIILQLTLPTQTKIELIEGQQNGGWYSPRFGVKQPSTTVYASLDATLPITLTTEMEVTYEKG